MLTVNYILQLNVLCSLLFKPLMFKRIYSYLYEEPIRDKLISYVISTVYYTFDCDLFYTIVLF